MVTCIVVFGVQQSVISSYQNTKEELTATKQELEQLRTANEEFKSLQGISQSLERLRFVAPNPNIAA